MLFTEQKSPLPLALPLFFCRATGYCGQVKKTTTKKSDQNRRCDYRKRESDSGNRKKVSKIMKDVHQEEKTNKSSRSRRLGFGC